MDISRIEGSVKELTQALDPQTFIYELLGAYGKPKSSITRLQKGNLNLSKIAGEILWKNQLLFKTATGEEIHALADQLSKSDLITKHKPRFVVTTDWQTLLSVDTKTGETLDIPIGSLAKHFDFFLPWAGHEKQTVYNESQADIKAAYRMAKLYDQICQDNPGMTLRHRHELNVFLSRLLFCFFAEDTEIFPNVGMFTSSIASHTAEDGGDLSAHFDKLFEVMNKEIRSEYPAFLQAFPYVNGGLLSESLTAPVFSKQSRKLIIECGELDWSEINPDIFGSMIQAVVHPDFRSGMGMHYTSVTNIMRVIEPLFLDNLREAFGAAQDSVKGLERLLERLYNIRFLDPACGSGNFLIIAYKELRKLEMEIYHRLREINPQGTLYLPRIRLTQFFGIELDDFAHEIATLSMWLAEHQMNVKFKDEFGQVIPPLPLKESGRIVCGNAAQLDWNEVCPKEEFEVYVFGNPPYIGMSNQNAEQKADMAANLSALHNYKLLDYISCWFYRGAHYIRNNNAQLAFVSTNSIVQGQQVELLWPKIFDLNLEIGFAQTSFKWSNNAKHNAGVSVVIINLRNLSKEQKMLFSDSLTRKVENINAYLANSRNIIVKKRDEPVSKLPRMIYGNKTMCADALILSPAEKDDLVQKHPEVAKYIKKLMGSNEFINGIDRYCLWISDAQLAEARSIKVIADRIDRVTAARSKSAEARRLVNRSHQFREFLAFEKPYVSIPEVSSERREYVPVGFLEPDTVITNKMFAIDNPELWVFSVISSRLHNVWVRAVGGRLEQRISYSAGLCYYTFPMPELSAKQKETLTTHVVNVLGEREEHSEKSIAELYDPDLMPPGLRSAHEELDLALERCYRSKPFVSDQERLSFLFDLYEEMV